MAIARSRLCRQRVFRRVATNIISPVGLGGLALFLSHRPRSSSLQAMVITTTCGEYFLSGKKCIPRSGSYSFDRELGQLVDGDEHPVGFFSMDPISVENIHVDTAGDRDMPMVTICNSEIMLEIQKPENAGAYFILPSQLNGAEYPSNSRIVRSIDEYRYDNTGGPRGQLAVHPAAGQFVLDNAANDERPDGINAVREILVILNEAGFPFRLENGYLVVPRLPASEQLSAIALLKQHLHRLRLLQIESIPADGLLPGLNGWSTAKHTVHLVYASAVPVQAYTNLGDEADAHLQQEIASLVLLGQYLGALKSAASSRSSPGEGAAARTRVYLMLLGGGVFNNPPRSIYTGMSKAIELLTPDERERLDIRVLTWDGNPQEYKQAKLHLENLRKLKPTASSL